MLSHIPHHQLLIRAITLSDRGCVRQNNEDSARFLFMSNTTDFFAVLADGMGGYEYGEIASALMVDTVCNDNGRTIGRNPRRWLSVMVRTANRRIRHYSRQYSNLTMGTTCSLLLIKKRRIWCANIGDSRIYLLKDNILQQISTDDTVVKEMLRRGEISAVEAATHPQRNILTRAIGTSDEVEPDVFAVRENVCVGDRFLLCSDGLYDLVPDGEIGSLLAIKSLRQAAAALIDLAKSRGGYDNITVVIVEINKKSEMEDDL